MSKLPALSARQVIRALRRDGWYETRQRGSHIQFNHPTKRGRVTVDRHAGTTLPVGTLRSILNQAGLTEDEFRRLL